MQLLLVVCLLVGVASYTVECSSREYYTIHQPRLFSGGWGWKSKNKGWRRPIKGIGIYGGIRLHHKDPEGWGWGSSGWGLKINRGWGASGQKTSEGWGWEPPKKQHGWGWEKPKGWGWEKPKGWGWGHEEEEEHGWGWERSGLSSDSLERSDMVSSGESSSSVESSNEEYLPYYYYEPVFE